MIWVFVFGGIALVGLIMLICYAVWLAHKAADLWSELVVVGGRIAQIADLLSQINLVDVGVGEVGSGEILPAAPAPQPGRARPRARRMARGAPASPYL